MVYIARVNGHDPYVTNAQCWNVDTESWVPAEDATEFESEEQAVEYIEANTDRLDLRDVRIWIY